MKKILVLLILTLGLLNLGGCSNMTPEEEISYVLKNESLAKECKINGTGKNISLKCEDDPYTFLFTNFETTSGTTIAKSTLEGELGEKMTYIGLGIVIQNTQNGVLIADTYRNNNGLMKGDIILKVNGKEAESVNVASELISGKLGDILNLLIKRDGKIINVKSTLDKIKIKQYKTKIIQYKGEQFGYLKLMNISENIGKKIRPILEGYKDVGCVGIILDLRDNGGGYMGEAIEIAKNWSNKGDKILIQEMLDYGKLKRQTVVSNTNGILKNFPTIILVNGQSASASEIITAAIRENNPWYAKIVGTKTYGKGTIQVLKTINKNIELKYTAGKWYTPSGLNLSRGLKPGNGLQPDIIVKPNFELFKKKGIDNQLETAKKALYKIVFSFNK